MKEEGRRIKKKDQGTRKKEQEKAMSPPTDSLLNTKQRSVFRSMPTREGPCGTLPNQHAPQVAQMVCDGVCWYVMVCAGV